MKRKIYCYIAGLCFLFALPVQAQQSLQMEAVLLRKVLEQNHYDFRQMDDRFSDKAFIRFIKLLDPKELYFTAADIKALSAIKGSIDDDLKGKSWIFLPQATALYKQRLLTAEKTYNELLSKPLNLSLEERIDLSESDTLNVAHNDSEYIQRWTRWLKYQTLWQLVNVLHDDTSKAMSGKQVLAREPEMRQKVKIIEARNLKRILDNPEGFENHVASLYFNAIASCYDPHSNYFSKSEWQSFESALSRDSYSFGMDLQENKKGNIEITRLVPGGPAWKSNELHTGDILLELRWAGRGAIDLTGASVDEVESILQASASDKLEVTVKKTDGRIQKIVLVKEKIRDEENIVKSYILKGEKKIGYISLPGFYSEWENMSGNGCANDVAKEIIKLKEEGIEGLIVDIRYNGGGSLHEGMNLAGIFINEGPLLMMQGKDRKPVVMKDMNRGTVYDGPLLVMVNGQSASASEVLAATLQDYNRAVIVGSRTFGKATGQTIMPLDTAVNPTEVSLSQLKSPFGIVKITTEKLYRVNGKSSQLSGVLPHVYLPDIYDKVDHREGSYPYALSSDSVTKKVYYTPMAPLPWKELADKSRNRIKDDANFNFIRRLDDSLPVIIHDMEHISLSYPSFRDKILGMYKWSSSMDKAGKKKSAFFTVENTGYEKQLLEMDTYGNEINEVTIRNLSQDIYIEESFHVIKDLINLKKQ